MLLSYHDDCVLCQIETSSKGKPEAKRVRRAPAASAAATTSTALTAAAPVAFGSEADPASPVAASPPPGLARETGDAAELPSSSREETEVRVRDRVRVRVRVRVNPHPHPHPHPHPNRNPNSNPNLTSGCSATACWRPPTATRPSASCGGRAATRCAAGSRACPSSRRCVDRGCSWSGSSPP